MIQVSLSNETEGEKKKNDKFYIFNLRLNNLLPEK